MVDGDTIDVHIDLGFYVWIRFQRIHLYGVEAPEPPAVGSRARALAVEWLPGLQAYAAAWELQKRRHAERCAGSLSDQLLLLEHAPVVTVGRNGTARHLVAPEAFLQQLEGTTLARRLHDLLVDVTA